MRIDELDEFQGITPQLVTDWLLSNGWQQTKPRWWERGEDGFLFDSDTFDSLWFWTHALAAIYTAGNVQALLCKINPRMRKGMPSQAAISAHDGLWIAEPPIGQGGIVVVSLRVVLDQSWAEWSFWPCDKHVNKVKWSTDANGVML